MCLPYRSRPAHSPVCHAPRPGGWRSRRRKKKRETRPGTAALSRSIADCHLMRPEATKIMNLHKSDSLMCQAGRVTAEISAGRRRTAEARHRLAGAIGGGARTGASRAKRLALHDLPPAHECRRCLTSSADNFSPSSLQPADDRRGRLCITGRDASGAAFQEVPQKRMATR
jgi:hypothetical protein